MRYPVFERFKNSNEHLRADRLCDFERRSVCK